MLAFVLVFVAMLDEELRWYLMLVSGRTPSFYTLRVRGPQSLRAATTAEYHNPKGFVYRLRESRDFYFADKNDAFLLSVRVSVRGFSADTHVDVATYVRAGMAMLGAK